MSGTILLVGGGKMGGALLAGWLAGGTASGAIVVVEPHAETAKRLATSHGVTVVAGPADIAADFRPTVVLLAVKPQMMEVAVPGCAGFAGPDTCFLSIAAGTPIRWLRERLGPQARVVRSMPNTPAAVGRGMTVLCTESNADAGQLDACEALLRAVGEVVRVADEDSLHAVTAVSGGGPAYVFLLVETLAAAGVAAGLDAALSMEISRATVAGAGALLDGSGEAPATLRENVTSPGGTTAEALRILMAPDGQQPLFDRAIAAAAARSRELAG